MITKTYAISLDIAKQGAVVNQRDMILVQGDVNVYSLEISMRDGGATLDLTEVDHAYIIFKRPDGVVVQSSLVVSDAAEGKLIYEFGTTEIEVEGTVLAEVELYGALSEQLTSRQFTFTSRPEISTDGAVESSSQYSVLQGLIDGFGDMTIDGGGF